MTVIGTGFATIINLVSAITAVIFILYGILTMIISSFWLGLIIFLLGFFIAGAGRALAIKTAGMGHRYWKE
tara:strand:- start:359 stop:571 length:213 start_codon:yes stop_codon:yes gene_type:complete